MTRKYIQPIKKWWILLVGLVVLLVGLASCANDTTEGETTEAARTETVWDTDAVNDDSTAADTQETTGEDGSSADETDTETETETRLPPWATPKEDLPRIDIYTEDDRPVVSKDKYVNATISVGDCDEAYELDNCEAQIRVRGNSTAVAPKKPYRIKFESKQSLLGLNEGKPFKNWCLMADYYDHSMLRTWATFAFADVLLDDLYYSSDCAPVEVYVNDVYMGVYLLCEQTQINDDRVDIYEAKDGETFVDIGYLMIGQGGRTDEPESIVIRPEITVWDRTGASMYVDSMNFALSGSGYTEAQKEYVSTYVSAVFKVVAAALSEHRYYHLDRDGTMTLRPMEELQGMTTAEKQIDTINAVFDIDAAVRMCVLDEIVKNLDAMTFNMYVDLSPWGDGRLTLAAPWDFDFAMGNTYYPVLNGTGGFYATNLSLSDGIRTNVWYVMLGRIDWFEDMCEELWQEKYLGLKDVAEEVLVRTYRYMEAYDRDWERWGKGADRTLIFHHCQSDLVGLLDHLDAGQFLYDWLKGRLAWLDRHWGDGSQIQVAPAQPLLELDLTTSGSRAYLNGFKRCEGTTTAQGLHLTLTEARDPYFYVDYARLSGRYAAEDYYVLEIEYMIPDANSLPNYAAEIFLCTGEVKEATAGVSVLTRLDAPDGEYHTLRIDLSESAFWSGAIHKIRIDFFHECAPGDEMVIRSIKLLPQ